MADPKELLTVKVDEELEGFLLRLFILTQKAFIAGCRL